MSTQVVHWVSADTSPSELGKYLVRCDGKVRIAEYCFFDFWSFGDQVLWGVTHWAHLPEQKEDRNEKI